jgi:hypothetical protein
MDARAGLPGLTTRPRNDRRLNLTFGVALALHALLWISGASTRPPASQPIIPLRDEIAVRVVEEELAPTAGGSHPDQIHPEAEAAPPPPAPSRAPRSAPRSTPPHEVLSATAAADPPISKLPALPSPVSTSDPPRFAVPSNSRANQRLGAGTGLGMSSESGGGRSSGSGSGGLFGNGRFQGDGPGALKARVCFIPESTRSVTQLGNCEIIFEQFLDEINVPARRFEAGFPGFEARTEWFSVDISGTFTVSEPGVYRFRLKSDDGSRLYVDKHLVVDNDGIHDAISKRGSIELAAGRHHIALQYFQGMKFILALQLFVTPPGSSERLFESAL